jgi:putative transposase
VELNPVKAGMVDKAEAYEWSSYPARVGLLASDWLDEPESYRALATDQQARIEAYRQFVEQENGSPADVMIREAINSNKLTGGHKFVDDIENRIGIRVEARKPGRPTIRQ